MSDDDLTQNLPGNQVDDKVTQPSITAVFRLLQDIDKRFNSRFEALETRLEAIDTRFEAIETRLEAIETRLEAIDTRLETIDTRFEAIDTRLEAIETRLEALENRVETGFIQLGDKLADQMDHLRLHTEADYQDLLRRMRRLESQAS